jgi:hypothetical protein
MSDGAGGKNELAMDAETLHREEVFTDLSVGSIHRYTPVRPDGTDDATKPVLYVAHTQLMTQMGMLPIEAPVEAGSLAEAIAKFPQAVEQAVNQMAAAMERRQREQASRIVVPGAGGPDLKLM